MVQIARLPRVRLACLPTALEELPNLSRALGGPRIFIKRDDNTGLAVGGNKARKLEFLVADALAKGADTLITTGGPQSNHCRMTAAAARKAGLRAVLLLTGLPVDTYLGNLLLDSILGAEVRFTAAGTPEEVEAGLQQIATELREQGARPYVIPLGGSNALGAVGYVTSLLETVTQATAAGIAFDRAYVASGSAGTQAGLELGARMVAPGLVVQGISVSRPSELLRALVACHANACAQLLGVPTAFAAAEIRVDDRYVGPGYAQITPGGIEAIELLGRTEGIILDPVYTGKAMAGLIDHIRQGLVGPDETVVFFHTGGSPALNVYTEHFQPKAR